MINVKISDIVNSADALKAIMEKPLKSKVAYKVARLAREVDKEYNLYEEKRAELIKKYAPKDENGEFITKEDGTISVANENVSEFQKEMMELVNLEIELNVDKISLNEFDGCNFTPNEMVKLMAFVEE